jgi:hypothetical protein
MGDTLLTFENRWASEGQARHWMLRLEREGEPNVRAMYADHELHSPTEHLLFEDVPIGFARDWLACQDRERRQRRRSRHRVVVGLLLVLILMIAFGLFAWWLDKASG